MERARQMLDSTQIGRDAVRSVNQMFNAAEMEANAEALDLYELEGWDDPTDPLMEWHIVNWPDTWNDSDEAEWLVEPLIAQARGHAVFAIAGGGKSWTTLAACLALATGRPFLDKAAGEPVDVLYLDYEMTMADLRERLESFGYGPTDDLSHLHYCLIPSTAPLDTDEGGRALVDLAVRFGVQLVVIDTSGRAIEGDENDADAIRAYYRHTGQRLKSAGIAVLRIDHAGKDAAKGQRGTSAKNDDVDIVWQIERTDNGQVWHARKRRTTWVPEKVTIEIVEGGDGIYRFYGDGPSWPAGTAAMAAELDRLGAPMEMGRPRIRVKYGIKGRNGILTAAIKYRRQRLSDPVPNGEPTVPGGEGGTSVGTGSENPMIAVGDIGGDYEGQGPERSDLSLPPYREGHGHAAPNPLDMDELY